MRSKRWTISMVAAVSVLLCAGLSIPPIHNVNIRPIQAQQAPTAVAAPAAAKAQTAAPAVIPQPDAAAVKPKADAAPPKIELPASVSGAPGSFIKITADTKCKEVRWVAISDGLAVFPGEMLKDSRSTVVSGQVPGSHRLMAYTASASMPSDPAYCTVTINGPAPPPGPAPGPDPVPGPAPVPTVPQPSAEATAAMAPIKALLANAPADKRAALANIWQGWHAVLGTSLPPTVGAYKQAMLTYLNAASQQAGLAGAFPGYGTQLEAAFVKVLGAQDGALPADKAKDFAAALFWACK